MRGRIIPTLLITLLLGLTTATSDAYVRDARVEHLEVLRTDPATVPLPCTWNFRKPILMPSSGMGILFYGPSTTRP